MIIIKIFGGLGNQMFQYAFGKYLSKRNDVDLLLDISYFRNQSLRKFELNHLNVKNLQFAEESQIRIVRKESNPISFLFRKLNTAVSPYYKWSVIEQMNFDFDPNYLKVEAPAYVSGYWHSENYFLGIADLIRSEFDYIKDLAPYAQSISNQIGTGTSCSIHIRRGDYVNDANTYVVHGVCSMDYYLRAIAAINAQFKDVTFFVFTDDIPWVKTSSLFNNTNFTIVENTDNHFEDFKLMSKCSHHIIANSSFSWWAAYLGDFPSKVVISPSKWFKNKLADRISITPKTWIQL